MRGGERKGPRGRRNFAPTTLRLASHIFPADFFIRDPQPTVTLDTAFDMGYSIALTILEMFLHYLPASCFSGVLLTGFGDVHIKHIVE